MLTLSQLNQYAITHNINSNTDIFSILAQMNLTLDVQPISTPSKPVQHKQLSESEWTFEQTLELFST